MKIETVLLEDGKEYLKAPSFPRGECHYRGVVCAFLDRASGCGYQNGSVPCVVTLHAGFGANALLQSFIFVKPENKVDLVAAILSQPSTEEQHGT